MQRKCQNENNDAKYPATKNILEILAGYRRIFRSDTVGWIGHFSRKVIFYVK